MFLGEDENGRLLPGLSQVPGPSLQTQGHQLHTQFPADLLCPQGRPETSPLHPEWTFCGGNSHIRNCCSSWRKQGQ